MKRIMKNIYRYILIIICCILLYSCDYNNCAYYETETRYGIVYNDSEYNDTLYICKIDTFAAAAGCAGFVALADNDQTVVINFIHVYVKNAYNNPATASHIYKYPGCRVFITDFKYRVIRNYKASRWDGHEIVENDN